MHHHSADEGLFAIRSASARISLAVENLRRIADNPSKEAKIKRKVFIQMLQEDSKTLNEACSLIDMSIRNILADRDERSN